MVVQWLGIRFAMQGTLVPSLVQEDPTCHRATEPVHHSNLSPWTTIPEARTPRVLSLQQENTMQWEACALQVESSQRLPQLERAHAQQWRPRTATGLFVVFNFKNVKEEWWKKRWCINKTATRSPVFQLIRRHIRRKCLGGWQVIPPDGLYIKIYEGFEEQELFILPLGSLVHRT